MLLSLYEVTDSLDVLEEVIAVLAKALHAIEITIHVDPMFPSVWKTALGRAV